MKLTELKDKIDEALKLHNDYDVKVNHEEIDECGIDPGRFNFNIYAPELECDGYHIEGDEDMEHCSICTVYYPVDKECPSCELKRIKKNL